MNRARIPGFLLMGILCAAPIGARADVERIAVLVGVNQGLASERPLRYAARDAQEMAALLRRSGTFDKERIYALTDASLDQIKGALEEVAGRIKEIKKAGSQTLVVFYYSGHGSADALHIKGKVFPRQEVNSWFNLVGGDIRIMILDACESGDFLRQKGGRIVDEDSITIADSLRIKGSAILSASSRGERAQESEEYRGAVFTHHLLNGLQGIADYNRDMSVTLMEAFDYARAATRMEKIGGRDAAQNPSFDFDLVGESDPILARLGSGRNRLHLTGLPAGQLDICEAGTYSFVNRVLLTGRDSLLFLLPAGKYLVGYANGDASMVSSVDLTWDGDVTVTPEDFRKRPRARYTEKGGPSWDWNPHGFDVGLSRADFTDAFRAPMFELGYTYHEYGWSRSLSVGFGSGSGRDSSFDYGIRFARLAMGAKWPILTWRYGRLSAGGSAAWCHVWQELDDRRFPLGPVRTGAGELPLTTRTEGNVFQALLPLELQVFLPGGIRVSLAGVGTGNLFREKNASGYRTPFGIQPYLGFGYGI